MKNAWKVFFLPFPSSFFFKKIIIIIYMTHIGEGMSPIDLIINFKKNEGWADIK
jgi:hypothetical protein